MQYLKILQDRYGDIDVKVKITYEDTSYDNEYTDVARPKYDKNSECVVIHNDFVSLSFD